MYSLKPCKFWSLAFRVFSLTDRPSLANSSPSQQAFSSQLHLLARTRQYGFLHTCYFCYCCLGSVSYRPSCCRTIKRKRQGNC
ncbi:hypothetical protein BDW22DRAFT_1200179 [Trametopsis cervina]|nr:hypothetical protein BDW22DRAFT_1200179 [Trametopsis cervina]